MHVIVSVHYFRQLDPEDRLVVKRFVDFDDASVP